MAFRDDRDALVERVQVLETELVETQRSRREAERAAARLPIVEKELERTSRALAERERGEQPRVRRLALLFALALVGLGATAAAAFWWNDANVQRERMGLRRQFAENEMQTRRLEGRARMLDDDLTRARQRIAELEERLATPPPPPMAPPAPPPFVPSARTVVHPARVERVSGPAPVARGVPCNVDLDVEAGECRAHVRCGGIGLYPDPGSGGYFACEADVEGPIHGADVRRTELSGDPRFDYDRARGRATVSDGADADAWEIELRLQ